MVVLLWDTSGMLYPLDCELCWSRFSDERPAYIDHVDQLNGCYGLLRQISYLPSPFRSKYAIRRPIRTD